MNKNVSGIKEQLEHIGREIAEKLANDAKEKLCSKYKSLLDAYYRDYIPSVNSNGVPYYVRTGNLYKSFSPYKRDSRKIIYYGGVSISADKMNNYHSINGKLFDAQRLLDKYIFTTTLPSGTWHGGDWHGGYGVMNSFSIYEEIIKYQNYLIDYYTKEYGIKE